MLTKIFSAEKFIGPNLTISHVQEKDMGSYLCIADNGVPPIVSKRIFLYVQCKYLLSKNDT